MLKDMHIHIERGEYSKKWIEQFVDKAVQMGIDEINLLEHSIRIKEFLPTFEDAKKYNLYQQRWVTNKALNAHSLDEYLRLVSKIKTGEYPVKINFGLEVCWFEQHSDLIRQLVDECNLDYVLGSVHWIDNWTFNQRKYQWKNKDVDYLFNRYYELNNSLIESNIFDAVAHPYLIKCHGFTPSFNLKPLYLEMCLNAKKHNMAVELNGSQIKCIDNDFISAVSESGVTTVLGSDAHSPNDVGKNIKIMSTLI